MSDTPAPAPAAAGKKKFPIALLALPLLAAGAGAAVPLVVDVPAMMGMKKDEDPDAAANAAAKAKKKKQHAHAEHLASVAVGDVAVNLAEERMTRFLRVKIALQCEHSAEGKLHELVEKNKAALKSWAIGHLAGKSLKEVSGTVAIHRLQREMLERFDEMLFPDGESPLRAVLFEEYLVQVQ
jgi:flagellar basal body-associated protein FliL